MLFSLPLTSISVFPFLPKITQKLSRESALVVSLVSSSVGYVDPTARHRDAVNENAHRDHNTHIHTYIYFESLWRAQKTRGAATLETAAKWVAVVAGRGGMGHPLDAT